MMTVHVVRRLTAIHLASVSPNSLIKRIWRGPAAAAVVLWALNLPAAGTNLLPNPSFEESTGEGISGWKVRSWAGTPESSVAASAHYGGKCVSLRSERGCDAAWTATLAVEPNSYYRLSGWVRTSDVRGAMGALLNIQDMPQAVTNSVSGTCGWTRVSRLFRTERARNVEVNCLFGGWGQSTGQAWFDDVALERVGEASGDGQGVVLIDKDAPTLAADPMVFGGFIEHFHQQIYGGIFEPGSPLSDEMGFRRDVIAALKEMKLSVVRWPGGCFASGYHWRDGVGKERKKVPDPVWGTDDPNTFGTDEFVEWCRRVGCEPYICTNAGNGRPAEMRDWVAYCNATSGPGAEMRRANGHPDPFNVRMWSIGNENWGGWEIGASTPEKWGPLVLESAQLMREVSPELKLLAAATPNRDWTMPLLRTAGHELQYVAIHEYWLPAGQTPDYPGCIALAEGPESTLRGVIRVLAESGQRGRIRIAFDEWNLRGWNHPGFPRKEVNDHRDPATENLIREREKNNIASLYTMADALFSASFFNAALRHADDVGMTNIAPVVNTRGPLFVHPKGLVKRTTFHVQSMYANKLQRRIAPVEFASGSLGRDGQGVPALDALATRDESGRKWAIALINRSPTQAMRCTVKLGLEPLQGTFRATVLAGDSPEAFNDIDHPGRVVPQATEITLANGIAELPPHSLTIMEVEDARAAGM